MRHRMHPLAAVLILAGSTAAMAADWQTVASDKKRTIELDRASILQSDPGTKVAWGRIVLSESEAAAAGYMTVKALNRYDCRNQTFATIKRVYLDADSTVVKDEKVKVEKDMPIAIGSVDEKLWRDVCKPADISQLAKNASRAAQAARPPRRGAHRRLPPRPGRREGRGDPGGGGQGRARRRGAPADQEELHRQAGAAAQGRAGREEPRAAARRRGRPRPRRRGASRAGLRAAPRPRPRVVRTAPVRVESHAAHGPAAAGTPLAHHEIHWSYDGEGAPANWGTLKPEWQLCNTGERQSPIDIRDGIKVELEPIRFDYKLSQFRIVDNGHTVQVTVGRAAACR
jgi:carbonic anhydrase